MFRRVTNLNPEFVLAYYKLSEVSWDLKQYQEIVDYLTEGLEVTPKDMLMHFSLALAYQKLDKNDLAIKEFQTVLADNPQFTPAYFSYGELLETQGNIDEAVVLYKKALSAQPEQNGYRLALANIYVNEAKLDKAENILQEALRHDSKNYLIYVGLGHVYYTMGEYNRALTMYESAQKLEPDNRDVIYYIRLSMNHIPKQQNTQTALQKASR